MLALYSIATALHFHGPVAPRHQDIKLSQATLEAPPARTATPVPARLNTQDPTLAIPLDLPSKLKVRGPPNHASAARHTCEPFRRTPMEPIVGIHLTIGSMGGRRRAERRGARPRHG